MYTLRKFGFMIGLLALLPLSAFAGGSATLQVNGETAQISWRNDNTVRVDQSGRPGYMVMRDGKAYAVTHKGGHPRVIEMGGMAKAFAQMAQSSGQGKTSLPEIKSLKKTGKSETVAGIRGMVYQVTFERGGQTETKEAVLTDDPLVVELTQTCLNSLHSLSGTDIGETVTDALPASRRGILRVGKKFVLESVSGNEPSAELFKLPAKPTSMANMLKNLGKRLQQQQ